MNEEQKRERANESHKRFYEKCKREHKCYMCRKQDYNTLHGAVYCFECGEKRRLKAQEERNK